MATGARSDMKRRNFHLMENIEIGNMDMTWDDSVSDLVVKPVDAFHEAANKVIPAIKWDRQDANSIEGMTQGPLHVFIKIIHEPANGATSTILELRFKNPKDSDSQKTRFDSLSLDPLEKIGFLLSTNIGQGSEVRAAAAEFESRLRSASERLSASALRFVRRQDAEYAAWWRQTSDPRNFASGMISRERTEKAVPLGGASEGD
jgi:hypothetical protein